MVKHFLFFSLNSFSLLYSHLESNSLFFLSLFVKQFLLSSLNSSSFLYKWSRRHFLFASRRANSRYAFHPLRKQAKMGRLYSLLIKAQIREQPCCLLRLTWHMRLSLAFHDSKPAWLWKTVFHRSTVVWLKRIYEYSIPRICVLICHSICILAHCF